MLPTLVRLAVRRPVAIILLALKRMRMPFGAGRSVSVYPPPPCLHVQVFICRHSGMDAGIQSQGR